MMKSEEIIRSHHPNACAFYAVINLCQLRGVEPPSYAELSAKFRDNVMYEGRMTARPYIGDYRGLLASDEVALLASCNLGSLCVMGVLPDSPPPQEILVPLLASGCHLILGYTFRHPSGRLIPHAVAVEGFCEKGYKVINSDPGYLEGEAIDLEPSYAPEEWERVLERYKTATHGTRNILPFVGLENPTGLHAYFVAVYPARSNSVAAFGSLLATCGRAWLKVLAAKVKQKRVAPSLSPALAPDTVGGPMSLFDYPMKAETPYARLRIGRMEVNGSQWKSPRKI